MQQQNPLANVRFDQTTGVVCENCSGKIFTEGLLLRRVSKFLVASSSDKDQVIPVPTFTSLTIKLYTFEVIISSFLVDLKFAVKFKLIILL